MTSAVSILPEQQLAGLNEAYRIAVRRKRLRALFSMVLFALALVLAAIGSEVNLRTLFTYFGNFVSYFDRILTIDRAPSTRYIVKSSEMDAVLDDLREQAGPTTPPA